MPRSIVVGTSTGQIYDVDLDTFATRLVVDVATTPFDIDFDANGNLYALTSSGDLIEIDPVTAQGTEVHDFGAGVNSLEITTSLGKQVFLAGRSTSERVLSWDGSNERTYVTFEGNRSAGDLEQFGDRLYMTTRDGELVSASQPLLGVTDFTAVPLPAGDFYGLAEEGGRLLTTQGRTIFDLALDGTLTPLGTLDGIAGEIFGAATSPRFVDESNGALEGTPFSDTVSSGSYNGSIATGGGNDTIEVRRGDLIPLGGRNGQLDIDGGEALDEAVLGKLAGAGAALFRVGGSVYSLDGTPGVSSTAVMTNVELFTDGVQTIDFSRVGVFDPLSYIAANADLIGALGIDVTAALNHYLNDGFDEGRATEFDAARYLANYADLGAAFGGDLASATVHYILAGANEGRLAADPLAYIASHADLSAAFGGFAPADMAAVGLAHYAAAGRAEGRDVDFDGAQYLANHADLRAVFGTDEGAAAVHYVQSGRAENRLTEDALLYVASYADLIGAFGGFDGESIRDFGAAHYQLAGATEGRGAGIDFDAEAYLSNYSDLRTVFADGNGGYDEAAATLHYIQTGFNEGRTDARASDIETIFG